MSTPNQSHSESPENKWQRWIDDSVVVDSSEPRRVKPGQVKVAVSVGSDSIRKLLPNQDSRRSMANDDGQIKKVPEGQIWEDNTARQNHRIVGNHSRTETSAPVSIAFQENSNLDQTKQLSAKLTSDQLWDQWVSSTELSQNNISKMNACKMAVERGSDSVEEDSLITSVRILTPEEVWEEWVYGYKRAKTMREMRNTESTVTPKSDETAPRLRDTFTTTQPRNSPAKSTKKQSPAGSCFLCDLFTVLLLLSLLSLPIFALILLIPIIGACINGLCTVVGFLFFMAWRSHDCPDKSN